MTSPHFLDGKSDLSQRAMLLAANLDCAYSGLREPLRVTDPHKEDEEGEQPVEPDTPEPVPGSPT